MNEHSAEHEEKLRRWRLILGGGGAEGTGFELKGFDGEMDRSLAALYGSESEQMKSRRGGSGSSAPGVARWLGDIRKYFPSSVVRVMQQDALERLRLTEMLTEPEMLAEVQPDISLVASLISLSRVIPQRSKETARMVVRKVTDDLIRRLADPLRSAISGALNRAERNRRPKYAEIDWNRTIRLNLRHYQKEYQAVVPEQLIGFGRKSQAVKREIILCIDQSGSMAASIVYSSIFGAVMASLPAVRTRLIVFDTEVVDLSDQLDDPVDILFGVQLGGGTYINKAVAYCQGLIREPANTIFVLISDLFEGGLERELLQRSSEMVQSGVQFITLLALSDEGAPSYDKELAQKLCSIGVPSFACTPDLFPKLMAAAIKHEDISQWAARYDIHATRNSR